MITLQLYDLDNKFITDLFSDILPSEGHWITVLSNTGQQEYYIRKVNLIFGVIKAKELSYVKLIVR